MKTLGTLENCPITVAGTYPHEVVEYVAKAAIDSDGSDNRHNDPCWQRDTTLRFRGRSIDAESVPYVVVPPMIVRGVKGIVMGAKAIVRNTETGQHCEAVVADGGPRAKIGEISCECGRRIGLSGNPNHGGTMKHVIHYTLYPNIPAVVNGVEYDLQRS